MRRQQQQQQQRNRFQPTVHALEARLPLDGDTETWIMPVEDLDMGPGVPRLTELAPQVAEEGPQDDMRIALVPWPYPADVLV